MKRQLLSFCVVAFFSALLVGTSKPKENNGSTPAASASAQAISTSGSAATVASASIPATTDWQDTTIKSAKVELKIPKGAKAPPERAGSDPSSGPYFTVIMPTSGYAVYVKAPRKPDIVTETKTFYKTHARGTIQTIFEADDALIANRTESGPAGSYCEVTVCSPAVRGKPMCIDGVGAQIDGTKVTKLTAEECTQVVAMVRSVKAAP